MMFRAAATGFPKPTFHWRKDGAKLSTPTAQSHTLLLHRVTDIDAGEYSVDVVNDVGTVKSKPVVLTLKLVKPVITQQPESASAVLGGTVELRVQGEPLCCPWRVALLRDRGLRCHGAQPLAIPRPRSSGRWTVLYCQRTPRLSCASTTCPRATSACTSA